ncbi:MAG: hypothetical protein J5765_02450 [Clostridia bacterium]|nr:hypothetical protein [Clostridia bacterium]
MREITEQAVNAPEIDGAGNAPETVEVKADNGETASVGKFANSEELLKAYNRLEAEFTKKCQLLKEAERRSETSAVPSDAEGSAPLYEREEWDDRVASFLARYPIAEEYTAEIASILKQDAELAGQDACLEIALARAIAKGYKPPESKIEDETFLEKYVYTSDKIRDRVVGDYLAGLSPLVGAPRTIPQGGAAAILPPSRPTTIEEAGAMAEKMLKTRRI